MPSVNYALEIVSQNFYKIFTLFFINTHTHTLKHFSIKETTLSLRKNVQK